MIFCPRISLSNQKVFHVVPHCHYHGLWVNYSVSRNDNIYLHEKGKESKDTSIFVTGLSISPSTKTCKIYLNKIESDTWTRIHDRHKLPLHHKMHSISTSKQILHIMDFSLEYTVHVFLLSFLFWLNRYSCIFLSYD